MIRDELKSLLNTVYEMEGLIDMAIRRGEEVPNGVLQLIVEKSEIMIKTTSAWNIEIEENIMPVCEDYSVDEEQQKSEIQEESSVAMEVGINSSEPDDNIEVEFVYDEESEEDSLSEDSEDIQPMMNDSLFDASAFTDSDADSADDEIELENDFEENSDLGDDENIDDDNQEDSFSCEKTGGVTDYISSEHKDIRKYFTINDRYRFRRELFSNNEHDFVDNLNLVQAMSCYEDAEDYFYNDLQWDSESEDVVEFMSIIFRYFNS